MHSLRLLALRLGYRTVYRLLLLVGKLRPQRGRGVKCILTYRDEVLLVRHSYGPRALWQLPGGAAHRGEPAIATAAREMEEELGVRGLDWRELSRADVQLEHMSVDLTCLHAELEDPTVHPEPVELEEARWFRLGELPRPLGSEVLELLDLHER